MFSGANGNGKSNMLEALYMLAISKSPRAHSDRDLVGFGQAYEGGNEPVAQQVHTLVSATVDRGGQAVRIQIDLLGPGPGEGVLSATPGEEPAALTLRKLIRVNGAPRRAAEMVGELNAVLFAAQDLDLVYGSPSQRRRYLDVLISQQDRPYLRALQRYQRALTQRNHLLRAIRSGTSGRSELGPWDERMAQDGGYIVAARLRSMTALRRQSTADYALLSDGAQDLAIDYQASFTISREHETTAESAYDQLLAGLEASAGRDIAQGHSTVGPHRDDMAICLGGADAARYASRGQARTAILALKLAEAQYLADRRGETPVLLLDDVLSELDPRRRELVMERVADYDQCLMTTAEPDALASGLLSRMTHYRVSDGTVSPS